MIETLFDYFILGGSFWNNLIYISLHELWMRSIIIMIIISFGIYAQSRFLKIKNAERRIEKLYSLLKSIRNINQLIVQEKNLKRLLDKSVKILVKTRGYLDAYIAIKVNKDMKSISHSGGHERKDFSFDLREDDKPACISEVLDSKKIKVIEDPEEYCSDCDFCTHEEDHKTVLVPMTNNEKISGILGSCIRKNIELDKEEVSLLREVANDLAFAVDKFRIKKEKEISEKKKEFLNTILRQDLR